MVRVSDTFKNYFYGFQEANRCQNTRCKKFLGVLKILSYFTVVFPLLAGIGYGFSALIGRVCCKKKDSQDERVSSARDSAIGSDKEPLPSKQPISSAINYSTRKEFFNELYELFKSKELCRKIFVVEGLKIGVIFNPQQEPCGSDFMIFKDQVIVITADDMPKDLETELTDKIKSANYTLAKMLGATTNAGSIFKLFGFENFEENHRIAPAPNRATPTATNCHQDKKGTTTTRVTNTFKNYFYGFQNVSRSRNTHCTKFLGVLKILSYFTVVFPLLAGLGYGISALIGRVCCKKKDSQDERVEAILDELFKAKTPTQKELKVNGLRIGVVFCPNKEPIHPGRVHRHALVMPGLPNKAIGRMGTDMTLQTHTNVTLVADEEIPEPVLNRLKAKITSAGQLLGLVFAGSRGLNNSGKLNGDTYLTAFGFNGPCTECEAILDDPEYAELVKRDSDRRAAIRTS